MPSFTDPNAFADPEDSELVRENKRILEDPCYYTFTDVRRIPPLILYVDTGSRET